MNKTYIIIGGSAAGVTAYNTLLSLTQNDSVILISADSHAYNTCLFNSFLFGQKSENALKLSLKSSSCGTILYNSKVSSIDPLQKRVILDTHISISYDTLLLATGSKPKASPLYKQWQQEIEGVFFYHSFADISAIKKYSERQNIRQCIIVGAGLSGLECADALADKGFMISIIEKQNRIMPQFLPNQSTDLIKKFNHKGIDFILHDTIMEIIIKKDSTKAVKLESGKILNAQLIIYAFGSEPNITLAQDINLDSDKAIVTNSFLQTSDSSIYAAGDCIESNDLISNTSLVSSSWPDAIKQGLTAAYTMLGYDRQFSGIVKNFNSVLAGIPLIIFGNKTDEYIQFPCKDGLITLFSLNEMLVGFTIVGPISNNVYPIKKALLQGVTISQISKEFL